MVRDHKWTLTAVAVIGAALLLTRGGLASLAPLFRLLLPVGVAVFTYRLISAKVRAAMGHEPPRRGVRPDEEQARVIDLCPKCGSYLRPGHRCQS